MTNKMLMHGECVITQIDQLPPDLLPLNLDKDYVIIAQSEVTGNHHQVLVKEKDIEFYEKDGILYAKVNEPTTIGCVLKERHDDIVLPVGYWEFKKAQEFDPIEEEMRNVAD